MVGWPACDSPLILKMHLVLLFCGVNASPFISYQIFLFYEFWSVHTQTGRPNIGFQVVKKLSCSDMYITFIFPEG